MSKKSLREIHLENTGLVSDKWELYLDVYEELFSPFREDGINLLEIGIQNGGSLNLWNSYFQKVEIIGCDINENVTSLEFKDPNISIVVGDATSLETREKIFSHADNFDLIIDDGSHNSRDIISTFELFFNSLNYNGTYVIEDLHCSYWQEYGGGLFAEESAVSYFKKIIDLINYESWGTNTNPSEVLNQPKSRVSAFMTFELINEIHSISFFNSLCVVRKKPKKQNLLGKRIVTGNLSVVEPSIIQGEYIFSAPDQSENLSSMISASSYHQKLLLQIEQKRLSDRNIVLENKYEDLTLTHSTLKDQYEDLTLTHSTLKDQYEDLTLTHSTLKDQYEDLTLTHSTLKDQYEDLTLTHSTLKDQYEDLTLTHSTLKDQYEDLTLTHSTLKDQYEDQKKHTLVLQNDLDDWKQSKIYMFFKLKEHLKRKLLKL